MSAATAAPVSPWRPFATAAYFLAVLVILDPGIGFAFGAWPPSPSQLPWRHISSGLLIVAAPMIAAAAVASLVAARVRGDLRVLALLRRCGLGALILGVPFAVLYTVDSTRIYRNLPTEQLRSFVALEVRMFLVMFIAIAVLGMFARAARLERGIWTGPEDDTAG